MPTLFDPLQVGDLEAAQPHHDGARSRAAVAGPERMPNALMARVLRAARLRRTDPLRGDLGRADGRRLSRHARRSGPTSRSRAGEDRRRRARRRRAHPAAALACRAGSPTRLPDGELPVAPSAIAPQGNVSLLRPQRPYVAPRALETKEIPGVVEAYRRGAENAQAAGFDGVEIHGANGYLLDQFLQDGANQRTDGYGGGIENRARLMLEVADAVVSVWGAGRVGMHLAPRGDFHDMGDCDLAATFGHVARELGQAPIAFLCARERRRRRLGPDAQGGVRRRLHRQRGVRPQARRGGRRRRRGRRRRLRQALHRQSRPAAPLALGAPLNAWNSETFYSDGPAGYTDYPPLDDKAAAAE